MNLVEKSILCFQKMFEMQPLLYSVIESDFSQFVQNYRLVYGPVEEQNDL